MSAFTSTVALKHILKVRDVLDQGAGLPSACCHILVVNCRDWYMRIGYATPIIAELVSLEIGITWFWSDMSRVYSHLWGSHLCHFLDEIADNQEDMDIVRQ